MKVCSNLEEDYRYNVYKGIERIRTEYYESTALTKLSYRPIR